MGGERLAGLVSFEAQKLAAGVLLLSPYIPLLFMGEEYGEDNPFHYFVSHSDPDLVEAVRRGRRWKFENFADKGEPPDPARLETFLASKIAWKKRERGNHRVLLALYRQLLSWRREIPCLARLDKEKIEVYGMEGDLVLFLHRWNETDRLFCVFNFNRKVMDLRPSPGEGDWVRLLDSADSPWNGPGTLLPQRIRGDETLTLRGESFAMFLRKGGQLMDKLSVPQPRIPVATYRVQFNRHCTFTDVKGIIPYLHELGISDIYASPYFKAAKGSLHGYDNVDPNSLNPEVGTEEEYEAFIDELHGHGMGQMLDIVPNHMFIESNDNVWWMDVMENGPSSPKANFFDIDWEPVKKELRDKVLIPILGDQYGYVLDRQELQITFRDGAFFVNYYDHGFPVVPESYLQILTHRLDSLRRNWPPTTPTWSSF